MKFLLTSSGISNKSINDALVDLLGKPIAEASALCVPTGIYPFSVGPTMAYKLLTGAVSSPMCGLGWKSMGVLELSVLPSIKKEVWMTAVEEADALLVWGGDPLFLRYWMRQSGLAEFFGSMKSELVYVGVSAGSMVTTPYVVETYIGGEPPVADDIKIEQVLVPVPEGEPWDVTLAVARGLGLVDFSLFPHMDHPTKVDASSANVERWAAKVPCPLYGIDDRSAIKVVDGNVEVVSEGNWKLFTP